LTPAQVWSTDTPSPSHASKMVPEVLPIGIPDRSYDRAGELIDALPALRG
jgi:hypothetical protein